MFIYLIKKKPFPKKLLLSTLSGVFIVALIYTYISYFFTFERAIDRESMQDGPGPVNSPTEKYTANAYYEPYGGAPGGVNVWVEITYHHEKNKVKTVYYSDAKRDIYLEWIDEDTLYIHNDDPTFPNSNRSIELKVEKEIYQEGGLACQSWLMKDEYEKCYYYRF